MFRRSLVDPLKSMTRRTLSVDGAEAANAMVATPLGALYIVVIFRTLFAAEAVAYLPQRCRHDAAIDSEHGGVDLVHLRQM